MSSMIDISSTNSLPASHHSAKLPQLSHDNNITISDNNHEHISSRSLLTVSSPPNITIDHQTVIDNATSSPTSATTNSNHNNNNNNSTTINNIKFEILDDYGADRPTTSKSIVVKECTSSTLLLEVSITLFLIINVFRFFFGVANKLLFLKETT